MSRDVIIVKKILLVEDNPDLSSLFEEILLFNNYQVETCLSFDKAKECLEKNKYDALVTDWNLNGTYMDKLLLNDEFQKFLPSLVIIVSAYSKSQDFPASLDSKFLILQKPFHIDVLIDLLRQKLHL